MGWATLLEPCATLQPPFSGAWVLARGFCSHPRSFNQHSEWDPLLLAEVSVSDLSSAAISVGRPSIWCLAGKGTFLSNVFSLSLSPCLRYTLWKSSTSKIYFCTGYILCFTWSGFLCFSQNTTPVPCLSWQREKNAVCFNITLGLSMQQVKRCDKYTC